MLLSNNVPSITDLSNGLRRRLKVFKFDRVFKEEEQDITLFDRIWATELPGILNRALQGWQQFVSNDHKLLDSLDLDLAERELFVHGNPLPAFIDECCEKGATYSVGVRQLYEAYTAWAKESGYNFSIVRNTLKRQFIQLGFGTKRVNGLVFATGLQLQQAKSPLKNNNWT